MTIRLRGHHLLCMLTFVGKGYTADFTAKYRLIAARLSDGEAIEIIDGPDDICQPLLTEPTAHCRQDSVLERDAKALAAVSALLARPVATGTVIVPDAAFLKRMRTAFESGVVRDACVACEWVPLCDKIAADGYDGVLVQSVEQAPYP